MSSISRTRSRRRLVLATFYTLAIGATGLGVAIAATPARGPAARGPATSPAANKAAAEAAFNRAVALFDQGRAAEDANKLPDAQKLYVQADAENEKALGLDPSHTNALLLKNALAKKIAAMSETVTTQGGTTVPSGKMPILTAAQVSMIRLVELGPDDARITGSIDRKTLDDYWQNVMKNETGVDTSQAAHDAFVNPQNFPRQARRIQLTNEMKYMEKVTITSDPAVIKAFRTESNAHNYVLQSCAAADCHGGDKGGNFRLVNPATSNEQVYTNYYILQLYSNADGKMIDRANADKSLLVQYSLPWSAATIKHPKVDTKKLTGLNDPKLGKIIDWIHSLGLTRPNYRIAYEVHTATPASVPAATASAPASQPK